jgi:hypothetical protein
MKKYLLGLFAIASAISMSAFTTSTKVTDSLYYKDGSGNFILFTGEPCPQDTQVQCEVDINGTMRPLYTQPDNDHPYLTKE